MAIRIGSLTIMLLLLCAPPAWSDTSDELQIEIVGAPGVVEGLGSLVRMSARVHNAAGEPSRNVSVRLTAYSPYADRKALAGEVDGATLGRVATFVADIPSNSTRFMAVTASAGDLNLSQVGAVHPLRFDVLIDDTVAWTATSSVIVVPQEVEAPLLTTLIADVRADVVTAAPTLTEDAVVSGARDSSVSTLPEELGQIEVPFTLALDNAVADLYPAATRPWADLLGRENVDRVLAPYATADVVALTAAELTDLTTSSLRNGTAPWPGTRASARIDTLAPGVAVDAAFMSTVAEPFGVRTLLLSEHRAESGVKDVTPSPIRPLISSGGSMQAIVSDPGLTSALKGRDVDALLLQRMLAETALVYLEAPDQAEPRGLVLTIWPESADGIADLLRAFDEAAWLELVTLDDLQTVATGPPLELAAGAGRLSSNYVEQIQVAHQQLDALAGTMTESDPALESLRTRLLSAASVGFRDNPAVGLDVIAAVNLAANNVLGGVSMVSQPTVTFTDSTGQLPIVLRNAARVPLQVRVDVTSRRLQFPGSGEVVELDPDSVSTILFDTQARTPGGTAPVSVVISDPLGNRVLDSGTIVVRIASYPLLSLVLVAGTAVFLLVWWLRDLRRRRQPTDAATPA